MNSNNSKIMFVFFGILAWLSTMFLFILPTLTPYQKHIESQNGISEGWLVVLLIIITLAYLAIIGLDLINSFATQVFQFVLLVLVVVCALPFITAFIIISFIIDISIMEIFIPILLVILTILLHIIWVVIPFMQSKALREARDKMKP